MHHHLARVRQSILCIVGNLVLLVLMSLFYSTTIFPNSLLPPCTSDIQHDGWTPMFVGFGE